MRKTYKRKRTAPKYKTTQRLRRTISTPRITRLPAFIKATGTEIKCVDINKGQLSFKEAPNPILLNPIQSGAAYYNRVGARVELKNIHIRGIIIPKTLGEEQNFIPGAYGRVVIVYDRSPNGVIPQVSDILQTRTQTGATSTTEYSEINLDNRDRFIILRDTEFYLPDVHKVFPGVNNITAQAFPNNTGKEMMYNEFIKLKGLVSHFKGNTNPIGIGDIVVGAIYALAISAEDSDDNFSLELQTRIRFEDN